MSKKQKLSPERVKELQALLPPPGEQVLADEPCCQFCKGPEPNRKTCYAAADFGCALSAGGGAAVSLQIPCCDGCRKNLKRARYVTPVCIGLGMAVGALFGLVLGLHNALAKVHMALPLLLYLFAVLVGAAVGLSARQAFKKRGAKTTRMSARAIPYVREMEKAGWQPLREKAGGPDLTFLRRPAAAPWAETGAKSQQEGQKTV